MREILMRFVFVFVSAISLGAPASAGSITYGFVNYASLQEGDTLSGFITTDGTIGTLTAANIITWSVKVTGPSSPFSISSAAGDTILLDDDKGLIRASSTEITFAKPTDRLTYSILTFNGNATGLEYLRESLPDNFNPTALDGYAATGNSYHSWVATSPSGTNTLVLTNNDPWTIATTALAAVPEPSTAVLAGLGGVGCAFAAYRRRRATVSTIS